MFFKSTPIARSLAASIAASTGLNYRDRCKYHNESMTVDGYLGFSASLIARTGLNLFKSPIFKRDKDNEETKHSFTSNK